MNKHIAITGATSGIGKETARELLKRGERIFLIARNEAKAKRIVEELKESTGKDAIEYIIGDLADNSSVKHAAKDLLSRTNRIDVLINNAGGIIQERKESKDGFELQFAMNHLGHFLLTQMLMEVLIQSEARIINVSSEAHRAGKLDFENLQFDSGYSAFKAYSNVKLCNILFTHELTRRFASEGVSSFALHPGVVNSNFGGALSGAFSILLKVVKPFMITSSQGAETTIYLATEPGIESKSGSYFKKKKPAKASAQAHNDDLALRLWEVSEALLEKST